MLGRASATNVAAPGCATERESVWSSPATAIPLTVYEQQGRFVGYRYGVPVSEIGIGRGPGAVLLTSGQLTLGDTVAHARRRYGSRFSAHTTTGPHHQGGGEWQISIDGGVLYGALLPVRYPMRTVTPANPIATIVAGRTDCSCDGS